MRDAELAHAIAAKARGEPMSPQLRQLRDTVGAMPMDDKVAEGPHARASDIGRRANASKWPWQAASMRLEQNIRDHKDYFNELGFDFQDTWNRATGVL